MNHRVMNSPSSTRYTPIHVVLALGPWPSARPSRLQRLARAAATPYVQAELSVRPFLQAADEVLRYRNVTDAALVFNSEDGEAKCAAAQSVHTSTLA